MPFQQTSLIPPKALLRPLFLKPAFFWVFVRAAMAANGALVPAPIVSFAVLAVVFVMVLADMKVLRERPFLDNLGIGRLRSAAVVVVVLEAVAGVAGRMPIS